MKALVITSNRLQMKFNPSIRKCTLFMEKKGKKVKKRVDC